MSETYFNGDNAETLHDIRSATKSITAALMGIAIKQGLVHSVDDSIALYLPGLPHDGKQNITIRDLLTMRSGLAADDDDPTSPGNEDNLDKASDWLKAAYALPVKEQPRAYLSLLLVECIPGRGHCFERFQDAPRRVRTEESFSPTWNRPLRLVGSCGWANEGSRQSVDS